MLMSASQTRLVVLTSVLTTLGDTPVAAEKDLNSTRTMAALVTVSSVMSIFYINKEKIK
jgi:hypothetical protein